MKLYIRLPMLVVALAVPGFALAESDSITNVNEAKDCYACNLQVYKGYDDHAATNDSNNTPASAETGTATKINTITSPDQ